MGGGTNSYREIEETEVILLWGSNARETHPIFFHHLLKGVHNGAKLFAIDPRRTSSVRWADSWIGLDVGTDIVVANAMGREIIAQGWHDRTFIDHATTGFDDYWRSVESFTLEEAERLSGVPASSIHGMARAYATAKRAMICWTLGITEHHNGVDNVSSLINLALLTGHVGRFGSGLNPLRGQNNVQGGGDMGALPDRFPGFQHVEVEANRLKFESAWNTRLPVKRGWNLTGMLEAMGRGDLTALMILGENPLQSEADRLHTEGLLRKLDFLVVQDLVLTPTAELAHVVLPAATGWCESDGTVTNSERRVQRVRKALNPPGEARDDAQILHDLARAMGHDWGPFNSKQTWDELRALSPVHSGISYERLEQGAGLQWPCYDEAHPGEMFLHSRLWEQPLNGPKVVFQTVRHSTPVEPLTAEFPLRLTTGRRLSDYNTGVQTGGFDSPLRRGETLDLSPEDAASLGVVDGETVRVVSPRGAIEAPVRLSNGLRPGLVFMTFHFQDKVNTNILTIDATDPRSGTAEFKACSIRVEKMAATHRD